MKTISRYIMTLALLLTAVTGAWAQSYEAKVFDVPASWAEDQTPLSAADLPKDFVQITKDEAKALAVPDGNVVLIYGLDGENVKMMLLVSGTLIDEDEVREVRGMFEQYQTGSNAIICYPAPGGPKVAWNASTKTGTFTMPASNVELQVEYEPTKVTMAVNDKTMGTVEVSGESKVEWTADTWKGWTSNTKEYTVDDITMTSTQNASIYEYTYEGKYLHSLRFSVEFWKDNSTVTFSTTGDPFSRIEFTMIDENTPNIIPDDNWTFEGKNAVWEGEATKSLTLQNCSTYVSKITFFKGAIPDGVTINGDGTFTVAKTATVTLKATPAEGYKFLYWEDDHTNTNPVREVAIESGLADMTYKAVFAENEYNITFAEGTNSDPENPEWTATPNPAKTKQTVTVTYSGTRKVMGVKAEKKVAESLIVNPVVGQVIGSDGKNYDANATLPDGVTKVAMIAYVGSETGHDTYKSGLAIALRDEGEMDWATAKSTCEAKSTFTNAAWMVPSVPQWMAMCTATGNNGNAYYGSMKYAMIAAAGEESSFKEDDYQYWSSSEGSSSTAFCLGLKDDSTNITSVDKNNIKGVRAVLAF